MLNIKTNSRVVLPGDTFVAISGNTVDGHDFIHQAIKNGAVKIIAEKGSYEVDTEIVSNSKDYLIDYLVKNFSEELSSLKLVGITGTNGKTTTCFMVYEMLLKLGVKAAYVGTIGLYINGKLIRELPNTTPDVLETYNILFEAKENNVEIVVMEASSHALELNRLAGLKFNIGGFTNLTQDHLDFHGTMENYLNAKKKIQNILTSNGIMIVNADDEYHKHFCEKRFLTFGNNGDNYKFKDIVLKQGTTEINFIGPDKREYKVETNFTGNYNVYNYILALAFVVELSFEIEEIIKITSDIFPPKGRCQSILANGINIVVDYAHTPDAVRSIIDTFNEIKAGKVITVIGCGGDRDATKRPIMGAVASDNSDFVVFTNDNPRTEDEKKIMQDILNGVSKDNYIVEHDREKAIQKAIKKANPGDAVLILGKGHEDYQIIGNKKIHLDDMAIVEEYIKKPEFLDKNTQ